MSDKSNTDSKNPKKGTMASFADDSAAFLAEAAAGVFGTNKKDEVVDEEKSSDEKVKEQLAELSEAKEKLSAIISTTKDDLDAGVKNLSESIDNAVKQLSKQIEEDLKIKEAKIEELKGIIAGVGNTAGTLIEVAREAEKYAKEVDNQKGDEEIEEGVEEGDEASEEGVEEEDLEKDEEDLEKDEEDLEKDEEVDIEKDEEVSINKAASDPVPSNNESLKIDEKERNSAPARLLRDDPEVFTPKAEELPIVNAEPINDSTVTLEEAEVATTSSIPVAKPVTTQRGGFIYRKSSRSPKSLPKLKLKNPRSLKKKTGKKQVAEININLV